jgi:phosphoglycolate phosphatase
VLIIIKLISAGLYVITAVCIYILRTYINEEMEKAPLTLINDSIITEDMYIMIGVQGEIYPISEVNFNKNYIPIDMKYDMKLKYHPKAKIVDIGKEYSILEYAKCCESTSENIVYAKPLTMGVKVFTSWDKDCYLLGEPGDYFVAKEGNLHDMYVVEKNIFALTYAEIEN